MPDLIVDHAWRPPMANGIQSVRRARAPYEERPCEYMNCGRPRAEHERVHVPKSGRRPTVDWNRYKACDVCGVLAGQPCLDKAGLTVAEGPLRVEAAMPHSTRPPTAAAAREGGDR